MSKTTLNLSPLLTAIREEADRLGVSFPALLTTDTARYRWLAEQAVPPLTEWQWGLLSHVLDGIERRLILSGDDRLPSVGLVIAEIESWCDGATDGNILRARALTKQLQAWTPLTIAGVLLRLRRAP